MRSKPIVERSA